jgi:hypothetical protein
MVMSMALSRLLRSTTLVSTLVLVAAAGLLFVLPLPDSLPETATTAAAVVLGSFTGALALSRLLFWSSPSLGALYQRTEEASLDDVSVTIAKMRRWVPRHWSQRLVDSAALVSFAALAVYLILGLWDPGFDDPVPDWTAYIPGAAVVVAVTVVWRLRREDRVVPDSTGWSRLLLRIGRTWARHRNSLLCSALLVTLLGLTGVWRRLVGLVSPAVGGALGAVENDVLAHAVALALTGLIAYGCYLLAIQSYPRRPVVLVVDDLDRCSAEKTVSYLETIHTMLRVDARPRWATRWRAPSPLVVIAVADARWVRDAFAKHYEDFEPEGASVEAAVGDRFVQKLFDHRILLPDLTVDQSREYVRCLSNSDVSHHPDVPAQHGAHGDDLAVAEEMLASADPLEYPSIEADARASDSASSEALLDALSARRSTEEYEDYLTLHLINKYAELMPKNPRSIKRVANAWAMLQALQMAVGGDADESELVAAAILMIEFPGLLDHLRSGSRLEETGVWLRPRVLEVRAMGHAQPIGLETLARCYGWGLPEPDQILETHRGRGLSSRAPATPRPRRQRAAVEDR